MKAASASPLTGNVMDLQIVEMVAMKPPKLVVRIALSRKEMVLPAQVVSASNLSANVMDIDIVRMVAMKPPKLVVIIAL